METTENNNNNNEPIYQVPVQREKALWQWKRTCEIEVFTVTSRRSNRLTHVFGSEELETLNIQELKRINIGEAAPAEIEDQRMKEDKEGIYVDPGDLQFNSPHTPYLRHRRYSKNTQISGAISELNFDLCRSLIAKGHHLSYGTRKYSVPALTCVCKEKAKWDRVCVDLGIDPAKMWTTRGLQIFLDAKKAAGNVTSLGYQLSDKFYYQLEAVLLDRIFENIADLLLENGTDVNTPDWAGMTPLHHCAEHLSTGVANRLLMADVDTSAAARIDSWIHTHLSPLYHAVYHMNPTMIRFLIEADQGESLSDPVPFDRRDFAFLPITLPEKLRHTICTWTELNPLSFLLFTFLLKVYKHPKMDEEKLDRLLRDTTDSMFALLDYGALFQSDCIVLCDGVSHDEKLEKNCKGRYVCRVLTMFVVEHRKLSSV